MVDLGSQEGHCWLCGCDGKPRWQLRNLVQARDIQLLPGDRVLVPQGLVRRFVTNPKPHWVEDPVLGITERDLDGKITWQYRGAKEPAACRRLSNGNTRILARGPWSAAEVNPAGKRVFYRELPPRGDSCGPVYPFILSNGHIAAQQMENPMAGYEEWDFRSIRGVGGASLPNGFWGRMMDVLPNGNHLLAGNRVTELDFCSDT
jgi:hypothetical protein